MKGEGYKYHKPPSRCGSNTAQKSRPEKHSMVPLPFQMMKGVGASVSHFLVCIIDFSCHKNRSAGCSRKKKGEKKRARSERATGSILIVWQIVGSSWGVLSYCQEIPRELCESRVDVHLEDTIFGRFLVLTTFLDHCRISHISGPCSSWTTCAHQHVL